MKKLSKKHIVIITIIAIVIIGLVIISVICGINNGKKKQTTKKDDKIESVQKDKADEEEKEKGTENDETSVVDDESEEGTTGETPDAEEPKQETPKTETPSNTNQNQNNSNTNTNTGSNTGNSGGSTTPTTPSTPTPTPTPEPEKSPYAGMYTPRDEASKTRFITCGNILRGGLAGQYIQVQETFIDYFSGEIVMSNSNTDGSWMYLCIAGWSTNGGTAETAPIYDELPSLAKQCMETIAPEGGTALYNTINSLILQYGGARRVPTQGKISESIPGLYVTVTQGRSGLEIEFWAE